MGQNTDSGKQSLPYELPWPGELSQGMLPGLIWAGMSFMLLIMNWAYGVFSLAAMFIFFQTQRNTPVGRARRHYVRGRLAYRNGNFTEALEQFHQALEIIPEATAIYPVSADLYFMLDDIPKAKKLYQQYFQRKAEDHQMRIWYAGQLMERGLFAEAARELKKLPAGQRKDKQVVNVLAVCLLKTNHAPEALQILEPAVKQGGSDEQQLSALYLLAKAYIQTGEKRKARSILQKLEQEQPGFEDVSQLLQTL
ncbi:MAG: tetratricopeptide repeat protein [Bacillota bacterium]|nr:tetratricopeptide repeat protein [Bacillota bacterium]MDW7683735.1 tetratricopeptide repeat protein [Bacillota bacterium]